MSLISVILSTYNEPCDMIVKSIDSILNQTYRTFELILINDNPAREELDILLNKYEKSDSRIIYNKNTENEGLVYCLNKAVGLATGDYIARMDADDISRPDRLELQLKFMQKHNYDIVGTCIEKIDEEDTPIDVLMLPSHHENIVEYISFGSCVLHPTWLVKKDVYKKLEGYRDIKACEDYDFLLRAIRAGFKLGNIPQIGLEYRIRLTGISQSTSVRQKLTMYYLASELCEKRDFSMQRLNDYLTSDKYKNDEKRLFDYEFMKKVFLNGTKIKKIYALYKMATNRFFYKNILDHIKQKQREKYIENEELYE